jgi:hypothetical protein
MTRQQWIRYHELKHLVTRLGCTMSEQHHESMHVEKLCEDILWVVVNIRADSVASQHAALQEHNLLHSAA